MPTALVTGASGFLARYTTAELKRRQWRVVGIDRRPIPREEATALALDESRAMELPSGELAALLDEHAPEVIGHAAGPASVPASVAEPAADFRASVPVMMELLDAVRRSKAPARVIYLSSAAVYGNPAALPVPEDAPRSPISPYGFHRMMCEDLIAEFVRVYGLRACSVRIFSAYGPGLRRQVLWDVSQQALHASEVVMQGMGDETRDFVHAADVARGICAVIDGGTFRGEAYNLAGGSETSIRHVAELLCLMLGRRMPVRFSGTSRPGDPIHWRADIRRIQALGYSPQVAIDDGVAVYATWVRAEREKDRSGQRV
jgi:UDP-glucose 4-epimerase